MNPPRPLSVLAALVLCPFLARNADAATLFVATPDGVRSYDASTGSSINSDFAPHDGNPWDMDVFGNELLVARYGGSGGVGRYNMTTGVAGPAIDDGININGVAVSGSTVYVTDFERNRVVTYSAATGALLNANFITGLDRPWDVLVVGNTLYAGSLTDRTIGTYDATTGATLNLSFITNVEDQRGFVISGNTLYVTTFNSGVSTYNATTGALIAANFITGGEIVTDVEISDNILYLSRYSETNSVATYNATTGALINPTFVTGNAALSLFIQVPEPATALLGAVGALGLLRRRR